jgi:hypothetical protein
MVGNGRGRRRHQQVLVKKISHAVFLGPMYSTVLLGRHDNPWLPGSVWSAHSQRGRHWGNVDLRPMDIGHGLPAHPSWSGNST